MDLDLSILEPEVLLLLKAIGRKADALGVRVYLVGGMVRDILLGEGSFDIDVVVEGDGADFALRLASGLGGSAVCHPRFLTATVTLPGGQLVDVVSARSELYPRPGALPQVRPGSLADDLDRRDFTINALAAGLNGASFGLLRDDHGGVSDLRCGRVAVLHDRSFTDDPTRILRAVRYEKRFGFRMSPGTLRLLRTSVQEGGLSALSGVRYFNEFRRTLGEADPVLALNRLQELGAVRYLSYDRPAAEGLCKARTLKKTSPELFLQAQPWLFYLIVLMDRIDRNRIGALMTDLALPRDIKRKILEALQFETVLDMLVRKDGRLRLEQYSVEAVLFFLLKARSVAVRRTLSFSLATRKA